MDVTGKLPQAHEMLQKAEATQAKRGSKRSEVKFEGISAPIIQFDLPQLEEDKEAAKSTLQGEAKSETEKAPAERAPVVLDHQAFYCLTGNLFVVTDHFETIQGHLGPGAEATR